MTWFVTRVLGLLGIVAGLLVGGIAQSEAAVTASAALGVGVGLLDAHSRWRRPRRDRLDETWAPPTALMLIVLVAAIGSPATMALAALAILLEAGPAARRALRRRRREAERGLGGQ